jgi:hypothetical protein
VRAVGCRLPMDLLKLLPSLSPTRSMISPMRRLVFSRHRKSCPHHTGYEPLFMMNRAVALPSELHALDSVGVAK